MKLIAAYRIFQKTPNILIPLFIESIERTYYIQEIDSLGKISAFSEAHSLEKERIIQFDSNEFEIERKFGDRAVILIETHEKDLSLTSSHELHDDFERIAKKIDYKNNPFLALSLARISRSEKNINDMLEVCYLNLEKRSNKLADIWVKSLDNKEKYLSALSHNDSDAFDEVLRINVPKFVIEAIDAASASQYNSRSDFFRHVFKGVSTDEFETILLNHVDTDQYKDYNFNSTPFLGRDFFRSAQEAIPKFETSNVDKVTFEKNVTSSINYLVTNEARASVRTDKKQIKIIETIAQRTRRILTVKSKERALGIAFLVLIQEKFPDIYLEATIKAKYQAHSFMEAQLIIQDDLFLSIEKSSSDEK